MLTGHSIYCEMITPNIESLHCTPKTDSVLCVKYTSIKKNIIRDFSGSPVVKNLPSSARDMASIKDAPVEDAPVPHAAGQLSPHTATKTQCNQKKVEPP